MKWLFVCTLNPDPIVDAKAGPIFPPLWMVLPIPELGMAKLLLVAGFFTVSNNSLDLFNCSLNVLASGLDDPIVTPRSVTVPF